MNFSINRKLRKILSLALVLIMMTTLFAGCKKDVPVPEDEPSLNLDIPDSPVPSETKQTVPPETTEPPVVNENTGTVTSVLNIRSSPSTEATVVGTLNAGDKIEISRREVVTGIDWAYIIEPEAGWVVMEFVEMDIPSQQPSAPDTSTPGASSNTGNPENNTTTNIKGVVNASNLNIRNAPNTEDSKVQGSYNKGDVITILETKDGWGRTNKGWVKLEYVNTNSTTANNTTSNNGSSNEKPATKPSTIVSNGSTAVVLRGIVKVTDLNIRSEGSTNGERLGSMNYGQRVEILEKDGNWGRTKDGWICLDYIYQDGTTGSKTANGVVTGDQLNIRSGPGTGYGSVGSYSRGDSVKILEQFTYNGTTWGCTSKGWISMDYVDVGGNSSNGSNAENTDSNGNKTGTVIGNGLNIRSGAGTDYPSVGSLNYGDRVTIFEEKQVGDSTWGKISNGWISLGFVAID